MLNRPPPSNAEEGSHQGTDAVPFPLHLCAGACVCVTLAPNAPLAGQKASADNTENPHRTRGGENTLSHKPVVSRYKRDMRKTAALALLLLSAPPAAPAQTWFAFTLPWSDDTKTTVDASGLLVDYPGQDPATVIDARGHVKVGPDGHFIFEKTGKRARFWGVNFTFNASFPPCPNVPRAYEPADPLSAEKVARRLAKLGVNVVRFHHMDFYASPNGIYDPAYFPNDTQHLDAAQLQRFDYLVYQLRRNGIYSNINLKVARHFGPGDGVEDTSQFTSTNLPFFQGVSHYNQRMIELQKEYARQLLTHTNPYTGLRYVDDPGVLCVEIANEDSMFGNLLTLDGGLNYLPGAANSLPERYSVELDQLWNQWLRARYADQAALEAAWAPTGPPVDSTDRVRNGDFEYGMADWWVGAVGGTAQATAAVVPGSGPDGSAALRIRVSPDGVNWHVQGIQGGHAVEQEHTYEVRFWARADIAGDLTLDVMKDADPWANYGLSKTFRISTTWRQYSGAFRANQTDLQQARITFELGSITSYIWIDKVEFRETGLKGLEADENLTLSTVTRPVRSELGAFTPARILDLFRFYGAVDTAYFTGMRNFLRNDLGLKSLVTGTAPWWAYLGDTAIQSQMDFVDGHYYWDHPWWPSVPAWSPTGWVINNQPLVNNLQDLSSLASQAVFRKPFTVSEFNEPFPNQYAHEAPLLIALIGNLQDWDAIYMFDYTGNAADYADDYVHQGSYFSMAGNPVKSGQLPVASRLFLGSQSSPAWPGFGISLNPNDLVLAASSGLYKSSDFLESKGLDRATFLQMCLRTTDFQRPMPTSVPNSIPPGNVISTNGELIWNRENANAKFVRVQAAGVEGAIGFLKGRTHQFSNWSFSVTDGPDHLALLLQSRDSTPLRESRRMLLTVWTEEQNTGMVWDTLHTTLEDRWGGAPTQIRAAKAEVAFTLPQARQAQLWALDEKGARKAEVARSAGEGVRYVVDTGRDRTVWYELVVGEEVPEAAFDLSSDDSLFQMYSDGSGSDLQLGWFRLNRDRGGPVSVLPLLEYQRKGVTTSMVRLPGAASATEWRIPVVRDGAVDAAIGMLNPRAEAMDVTIRLVAAAGTPVGEARIEHLADGETTAFYLGEKFDLPATFEGSVELSAAQPFVALSLRSASNSRGDIFLTPMPAENPTSPEPLYLAQLVCDSSYSTEILLLNSHPEVVNVRLDFTGGPWLLPDGSSLEVSLNPSEMRRIKLQSPLRPEGFHGFMKATPIGGSLMPAVTAVMRVQRGGDLVSEVSVPASTAKTAHDFVAIERPTRNAALAIVNPTDQEVAVDLDWICEENPSESRHATVAVPPQVQLSRFLDEFLSDFTRIGDGILRVRSATPVATMSLLGTYNQRGDFLLTALNEGDRLDTQPDFTIPRILTGDGYRTLLFIHATGQSGAGGTVRFFDSQGNPMPIGFR
jgi:hypothetical protein